MALDMCAKCRRCTPDVTLHNSDDFLCESCASYNDECLRKRVMPDWKTLFANRAREESVQTQVKTPVMAQYSTSSRLAPSAPGEPAEQPDEVHPITALTELASMAPDTFAKVYVASLEIIHQNNNQDISDVISNTDVELLQQVHKSLCVSIISLFPQYDNRRIVNRVAKHKVVSDIIHMGSSVVNNLDNRELSKIFFEQLHKETDISEDMQTADLVQLVAKLCDRVKALESDVSKMKEAKMRVEQEYSNTHATNQDAPQLRPIVIHGRSPFIVDHQDDEDDSEIQNLDNVPDDESSEMPDTTNIVTSNRFSALVSDEDESQQQQVQRNEPPRPRTRITAAPKHNKINSSDTIVQVYIGGVSENTSVTDITNELVSLGIEESDIKVRLQRHRDNWKSFAVSVPKFTADKVYNKSAWPQGIVVQPFRGNRPTQQRGGQQASNTTSRSDQPTSRHKNQHQRNNQCQCDQHPRDKRPRDQRPRDQRRRDQSLRNQRPRDQHPRDQRPYQRPIREQCYDRGFALSQYEWPHDYRRHDYCPEHTDNYGWREYEQAFPHLPSPQQYQTYQWQ